MILFVKLKCFPSLNPNKECGNANFEIDNNKEQGFEFSDAEDEAGRQAGDLITVHRIVKCGEIVVCSQFIYQASTGNQRTNGKDRNNSS